MTILTSEDIQIIKVTNTSSGTVTIHGKEIVASGSYTLLEAEVDRWADDAHFLGLAGSGTIQVTDERTGTAFAADETVEAVDFMLRRETVPVLVGDDFITVTSGVGRIDLTGAAIVGTGNTTVISGTDTITVSGTPGAALGQLKNQIVTIELTGGSTNEWLAISSEDHISDQSPFVFPFPARIAAMGYTNFKQNTQPEIEIYRADAGDGTTNSLIFTWAPGSCRVANKSDFGLTEVTFNIGDKMGVFLNSGGGPDSDKPVVIIYAQISADIFEEGTENFGGGLS